MNPYPAAYIRLLKVGTLAYPFLVWALWWWSPLSFWGGVFLVLVMEFLPVLGLAQLPLGDDEGPLPRIPVYLSSSAILLALGWGGLVIGTREVGKEFMGLGVFDPVQALLWGGAVTVLIHLVQLLFFLGRRWAGIRECSLLAKLMPVTGTEKALFVLLSVAAGVGEELAFRGFGVTALHLVTGSEWGAAALSSLAFGLIHGYQGWLGVWRTGIMGSILAAAFILSGSLWPAIIAHIVLDVVAGLLLGDLLMKED